MTRYYWDKASRAWTESPPVRSRGAGLQVIPDIAPYVSPLGTGVVGGRNQRREELKRHGCREVDPGEYTPRVVDPEAPGFDRDYAKDYYARVRENGGDRARFAADPFRDD